MKLKIRPKYNHFRAYYKAPKGHKLTTVSIFAEDLSKAIKKVPGAIQQGKLLLYGIS